MATKETIADLITLMANVWKFPGEDLTKTAAAYQLALRGLSDDQAKGAVTALLSEWAKSTPPKPADILTAAKELRPPSKSSPRLPPREPSHEEIMHKIKCDTYHVRAITEVLGENRRHEHQRHWTTEEWRAISKRQAEMRRELGLPEPKGI